jgi:hypothetical protein
LDDILTSSADFLIEGGTENHKKGIRVIPFDVFIAALQIAAQHDDTKTYTNCSNKNRKQLLFETLRIQQQQQQQHLTQGNTFH